jgi:hypothetical protein
MSGREPLRQVERAMRDLLLWPFGAKHPACPDGYALRRLLWDIDAARNA